MANSIFGNTLNPSIDQARRIMSTLAPNQSPQQMLQSLVSQNPQFNYLQNLVNQNGGDIRATVESMAKQRGVDLNALYQQFMQR